MYLLLVSLNLGERERERERERDSLDTLLIASIVKLGGEREREIY